METPAPGLAPEYFTQFEAGVKEYLDRFYYGPKSWTEYLNLVGLEPLLDATRRGRSFYAD